MRSKTNIILNDNGREFRNEKVSKYLQSIQVHHIVTQNETKANYAERIIKTFKHKLYSYLLTNRTERYIDVLEDAVHSYNYTIHRSLGDKPSAITQAKEGESRLQQYLLRQPDTKSKKQSKKTTRKFRFKIGQTVRVLHVRSLFDREYSQKWTGELFKIHTRFRENVSLYISW